MMNEQDAPVALARGMLLRELKSGKIFRIVTPEGAEFFTVLCDINDKISWPFLERTDLIQQRLRSDEPDNTRLVIEPDGADPWKTSAGRRRHDDVKLESHYQLILPLISPPRAYRVVHPRHRNKLLNEHANLTGTSRQKLSRLLKRFWKRGLTREALLDDLHKCGGEGKSKTFTNTKNGRRPKTEYPGAPLTETVRKILNIAADWLLKDPKRRTYQLAVDHIAGFFGEVKKVVNPRGQTTTVGLHRKDQPTARQLQYLIFKERPYSVRRRAQLGEKVFDLVGRAFHGRADQHVTGPGDAFELDATVADIYLVSQFDRTTIVGRPTVYFAIDVFTRLVAGMYVGFEPPSWIAAMTMMTNVVTPKVAYCAQFGIDISERQWPCHFLPTTLLGDKGEMMKVQAGMLIAQNLLVHIENAPSWRPDAKSIVELRFNTISRNWAPFAPGYVDKDFNERGSRDYRLDAALTIYEFTQLIILAVIQHNAAPIKDFPPLPNMVSGGWAPAPLQIWEYGIATTSGKLRSATIDEVRRCVLPRDSATITHRGIKFKGDFYECRTAVRNDWFVKARQSTWRVPVAYDPRDLGLIWLCEDGNLEECTRSGTNSRDVDWRGKSLAEIEDLKTRNSINIDRAKDDYFVLRVNAAEIANGIVEKAEADKQKAMKVAGIRKLSVSDIRRSTANERAAERMGVAGAKSDLSVGPIDTSRRRATGGKAVSASGEVSRREARAPELDPVREIDRTEKNMTEDKTKSVEMIERLRRKK
jgi:hypothetical protein